MKPLVRMLKSPRVIILILALIAAFVLIAPDPSATGALVTGVERGSPSQLASVESGMVITEILTASGRSFMIGSALDLDSSFASIPDGETITLIGPSRSVTVPLELNGSSYAASDIGLSFVSVPSSNVKLGLDLSGGTRILLSVDEPEPIEPERYESLVDGISSRLNSFGLSDIVVRPSTDLSGNQYVLVEIAGSSDQQLRDVIESQGEFEARIGNETVFVGGTDITSVCRSAECSGIDPYVGCRTLSSTETVCSFFFQIMLRPEAAQRQADVTRDIPVTSVGGGQYLTENLSLVLDGELVDSLRISADLRGQATTSISISGSGYGSSNAAAREDALANMRQLQTILETGRLPAEVSIIQVDTVSPSLGDSFLRNAILVGLLALLAVIVSIVAVYRTPKLAIPISIVAVSETILILGVAAAINWNLDLASIAGIVIAIGTGVDDQIVIANEVLRRGKNKIVSWKQTMSSAFFIILGAYATTVAAMLPLVFAGAGMLRGFALTTIIGVTIGVLITRPAFASILEALVGEEK